MKCCLAAMEDGMGLNAASITFGIPKPTIRRQWLGLNSAVRLVTKTKRRQHITPVLIELHWLPVRHRIEYKLLLLTFNSLRGLAAPYLAELLSRHQPTRSLRSADAHLLVVPRSNLCSQGDRAFSNAAPRLWNNLPLVMRATDSQHIGFILSKMKFINILPK